MKLTFLGTRGNINVRSRRHRRHTSTLVSYRGARVMIDCGADWLRGVHRVAPSAIVITHAHPDHVDGLRRGVSCPVYAPAAVWRTIDWWPIPDRHRLRPRLPTIVCGMIFEVWPVDHSVIAPAVGYRITAGAATVFYVPDVLRIRDRRAALNGVRLYVGDGAAVVRAIVRVARQTGAPVGHAPIATQLDWCAEAGVARAIFTHCGRAIVAGSSVVIAQISAAGRARRVTAHVAHDGFAAMVRNHGSHYEEH